MKKVLVLIFCIIMLTSFSSCDFGNNEKQVWLEESMIDYFENRTTYSFYDEFGNQIKTVQKDATGNIIATRYKEYDENNNLIKTSLDSGNGELFIQLIQTYDETGRLIEKRQINPTRETVSTYEYDDQNRIISVSMNGVIYENYTYDENGNYEVHSAGYPNEYTVYFADGRISERYLNSGTKHIFSYNEDKVLTECTVYSGDTFRYKQIYHLDEYGNAVKISQVNASGIETVIGEYTYKLYTIKTK